MAVSYIPASLVEEYRSRPRGFETKVETGLVFRHDKLVAHYRIKSDGRYEIVPQSEDHPILHTMEVVLGDTLVGALNQFAQNCRDNEEVWAYLNA